jgi:hypothetical protein
MLFGTVTEKTSRVLKERKAKKKAADKPKGHGRNGHNHILQQTV